MSPVKIRHLRSPLIHRTSTGPALIARDWALSRQQLRRRAELAGPTTAAQSLFLSIGKISHRKVPKRIIQTDEMASPARRGCHPTERSNRQPRPGRGGRARLLCDVGARSRATPYRRASLPRKPTAVATGWRDSRPLARAQAYEAPAGTKCHRARYKWYVNRGFRRPFALIGQQRPLSTARNDEAYLRHGHCRRHHHHKARVSGAEHNQEGKQLGGRDHVRHEQPAPENKPAQQSNEPHCSTPSP
jgi:hypothetical protein